MLVAVSVRSETNSVVIHVVDGVVASQKHVAKDEIGLGTSFETQNAGAHSILFDFKDVVFGMNFEPVAVDEKVNAFELVLVVAADRIQSANHHIFMSMQYSSEEVSGNLLWDNHHRGACVYHSRNIRCESVGLLHASNTSIHLSKSNRLSLNKPEQNLLAPRHWKPDEASRLGRATFEVT